jgi:hypothetical protein
VDFEVNSTELSDFFKDIELAPIECDGFTRIAFSRLCRLGVPCQAFIGSLVVGDSYIAPHLWLLVHGKLIVDYRARMWLGDVADYAGEEMKVEVLSEGIEQLLLARFPEA